MLRRVLAAGAAVAALFAVCATGGAATRQARIGPIAWGACSDQTLSELHAQCGDLSVPLNAADPTGPQVRLRVSRLQHTSTAANYKGVILTNPGGPGASGLDTSAEVATTLRVQGQRAAADDYDWIGFDPRGTGASQPIRCERNYQGPDRRAYNPRTPSLLHYWLSRSNRYARACVSAGSAQTALLANDTTIDTARDMDSIRQALAVAQISYYGFSYGTYLGQVYATLYPANVARLILDSNVDPRRVWYGSNLDQDPAFQRNVNIWLGWLARHHSFYHLGNTRAAVSRRFSAARAALARQPAGGQVGSDEWTDIFTQAGYYQETWIGLGGLFAAWVQHPGGRVTRALVSAYRATDTPTDDNGYAAYLAVQCTDAPWPHSIHEVLADNRRYNAFAPFLTWSNAWFNGPCSYWRVPASQPLAINGSAIGNALLIDQTLDAATPFGAASRCAGCSRTPCCSPSPEAPRTPIRPPATPASSTRSAPT